MISIFCMAENKVSEDLAKLFESLTEEEWVLKVNQNWTVKDVLSHLAGWEEEYAASLADSWVTKKPPWFLNATKKSIDDFDNRSVNRYKDYSSEDLVERWKYLMKVFESEIMQIGIDRLKTKPFLFDWIFDEEHYLEHFKQVKKTISKFIVAGEND